MRGILYPIINALLFPWMRFKDYQDNRRRCFRCSEPCITKGGAGLISEPKLVGSPEYVICKECCEKHPTRFDEIIRLMSVD